MKLIYFMQDVPGVPITLMERCQDALNKNRAGGFDPLRLWCLSIHVHVTKDKQESPQVIYWKCQLLPVATFMAKRHTPFPSSLERITEDVFHQAIR